MRRGPLIFTGLIAIAVIAAALRLVQNDRAKRSQSPSVDSVNADLSGRPSASTAPAATTSPVTPKTYLELVRAAHRTIKQTELLTVPIDLAEAAHLQLPNDAYICGRGDLWISQPDAATDTATVLAKAFDEQVHLLRDGVDFVWWRADADGKFMPWVATKTSSGYDWRHAGGTVTMPTDFTFDWPRAIFWRDDAIIVPSARGVAIVQVERGEAPAPDRFAIDHVELVDATATATGVTTPQFVTDGQGVVAWVPADARGPIGERVARYLDGKWTDLDPAAWPTSIVHLVPLIDGSVLRITADGAKAAISLAPLASGNEVDEARVTAIVEQLSDPDPRIRLAAFQQLTQFGPAAWPLLERLRDEQPAEARLRIGQVLRDRTTPTLAGMNAVDGDMHVVSRDRAGGAVLYADKGVTVPATGDRTDVVSPAWLAVRPGRVPELLPSPMVGELRPDRHTIEAYKNEWIVRDDVHGVRRYIGRQWQPLVRPDERAFTRLIGIDARGRWVFGRSDPAALPTTVAASTIDGQPARTLIIDPTLIDPTPRLPGWAIANTKATGWTQDNWPAVNVDGKDYRLTETGWARLDAKKNERLISTPPTALPTTAPAVLVRQKDKVYLDGTVSLTIRPDRAPETTVPLPSEAHGTAPAHLVVTADERLLLMNTVGRVVQLSPTSKPSGALTVDATFTRKVPNGPIRRYWLDPVGRLCIAHDTAGLTVFFPDGIIPPAIRKMMPDEELSE